MVKRRAPPTALYSLSAVSEKCFDVVKMHSSKRSVHSVCDLRFAIGRFAFAALIFVVIRRMVFSWTPTSCRMSSRVHLGY